MTTGVPVLGVPEMDSEHAAIAALLAEAATADDDALPALLTRAAAVTADHFAHEELMMEAAGFPVLFCHRAQHKMLMDEFGKADALARAGDMAGLRRQIVEVVPTLIAAHVASVDRVTARFLRGELKAGDLDNFALPELAAAGAPAA